MKLCIIDKPQVDTTEYIEAGHHYTLRNGIATLGALCYHLKPRTSVASFFTVKHKKLWGILLWIVLWKTDWTRNCSVTFM